MNECDWVDGRFETIRHISAEREERQRKGGLVGPGPCSELAWPRGGWNGGEGTLV